MANTLPRFVTDRYNLVRPWIERCTRGTIVSQVTVGSFMHGRSHYWSRLCIRVNGIPASNPFPHSFFHWRSIECSKKNPISSLNLPTLLRIYSTVRWKHMPRTSYQSNRIQNLKNYISYIRNYILNKIFRIFRIPLHRGLERN